MWSLIFWKDKSTSVESSNDVIYSAKGTKIRWQEDGCLHPGQVVAQHDNQDFLLSLTLDTNGVLQFPVLKNASTQTTGSVSSEHASTQTVEQGPSKSELHSIDASSPCTSSISDKCLSSSSRLLRHQEISLPMSTSQELPTSSIFFSPSSSKSPKKCTREYPSSSIVRRVDSVSKSPTLSIGEPSTSTGTTHRRHSNIRIGRNTSELDDRSQVFPISKSFTTVTQTVPTSSQETCSPMISTSKEDNLVKLIEGSSLVISKEKLDDILFYQKDNPRAMVRKLLLLFVGADGLVQMTPFGDHRRSLSAIPNHIYRDVRCFVNFNNPNRTLDQAEYREVCSLLCRRLRNPRR